MNNMTTTEGAFRVENVSFKRARKQSEILKERQPESVSDSTTDVPVSLTPEQVKNFYSIKANGTLNMGEKRLYEQTIKWIDELFELRKKVAFIEAKQLGRGEDTDV